ncbi:hypothetical protein OG216_09500 [Streptomycetaceae bacterium NBC_01309]
MSARGRLGRAVNMGHAAWAIFAAAQAPPPGNLPTALQKQYAEYSEVRQEQLRRDAKRLTTKSRQPQTSLNRRDARALRGRT